MMADPKGRTTGTAPPASGGQPPQSSKERLNQVLEEARAAIRTEPDGRSDGEHPRPEAADGPDADPLAAAPARREGQARLNAILQSATDHAIIAMDLEGRVTSWNEGARRILGYAEAEILGREGKVIFTPEDIAAGAPEEEMLTAVLDGRAEDERWHRRQDGSLFWASGVMTPLRDRGLLGFLKILRDRTDSKQSEAAVREANRARDEALVVFDALLAHAPIGFAFLDRQHRYTRANGHFARISGLPIAAHLGQRVQDVAPAQAATVSTAVEQVFRTGQEIENLEIAAEAAGEPGVTRHWLTSIYPVQDQSSGWIPWVGMTAIDITERKRTEKALSQALHTQEILAREASHRVKNSLQIVASMLALQARATDSREVKAAIDDAHTRISTVAQVHDRLWRSNEVRSVDLGEFMGELCHELQGTAPDVRLSYRIEPTQIPTDQAIPLALVASELVTNAFKYACPEGEGEVTVRLDRVGDDRLRLEVADSGPGLPAGFDPSAQRASLGMRLVTGFVRQLNGRLTVSSGSPGARFVIEIPRRDVSPGL